MAARRLQRAWRGTDQMATAAEDEALRARNAEAAAAGGALEYIFRSLYLPEQGMFCQLPADLRLGTRLPVRGRLHCPAQPAVAPPPVCLQPLYGDAAVYFQHGWPSMHSAACMT